MLLFYQECLFAKYGPDCLYNCSGNCLDGMRCNLSTGKCDNSCKAGFTGDTVTKVRLLKSNQSVLYKTIIMFDFIIKTITSVK